MVKPRKKSFNEAFMAPRKSSSSMRGIVVNHVLSEKKKKNVFKPSLISAEDVEMIETSLK